MDSLMILGRWLHVGTAIVLIGGTCFLRFVLIPSLAVLESPALELLRDRVQQRWKRFVHAGIGLILLSGLYNYVAAMPAHRGDKGWHMLMGIKILVSLVIFVLGSALVGRGSMFTPLRQRAKTTMSVILILSAVVVGIAGYLKVSKTAPPASRTPASETIPAAHQPAGAGQSATA